MLILILSWVVSASAAETISMPRQYILDSPFSEEFSDRMLHSPFTQVTPQPLQITSPQFETLFSTMTSVQVRTSGSPSTSIRGSNQAGRVLYLLDNIPLNFLDGFGGSPYFVPTELLSHINVFEGPSSANYGANALGGSIHFVPQKRSTPLLRMGLSDTDTSFLPSEGGTLSSANIAALVPLIHSDKHQLQASVFLEKDRGDFPYETLAGSKERRRDNDQTLRRFTLWGRHTFDDLRVSHLLLFTDVDKTTPGAANFPFITEQNSQAFLAAVSTDLKVSPHVLWTSRLSYSLLHSDFADMGVSVSNSDKIWVNQNLAWEFAPGYLSQTTLDISHNMYTAAFVQDQKFDRTEPELAQTFIIPLTDHLLIEPTVRYLGRYQKTVYQLNIPYQLDSSKLWLTFSEGFRPPALTDLYANTTYFIGNPDLQPEKSRQIEAGYAFDWNNVNVSASIFQIDYENLMQAVPLGPVLSTKQNIGSADSFGLSTKINTRWDRWGFHLGYSALVARERGTNVPLRFSPEHQVFSSLSYNWNRLSLVLQQTLWSPFNDIDFLSGQTVRMKQWEGTDILMHWKSAGPWSVSFGIYNLFDQRRELTFGYPEPQRRTALAVEYSF